MVIRLLILFGGLFLNIGGMVAFSQTVPPHLEKGKLLYENNFNGPNTIQGWRMEGPGKAVINKGALEIYAPDQEYHHVLWCPVDFPSNFIAEWDVQNLDPAGGLVIIFFAAKGAQNESIFDPKLKLRDGTFSQYTKSDINTYHISYYADSPENTDRELAHLRKNKGFNLVYQGPIGIPKKSMKKHHVQLTKLDGLIEMYIDDRLVIHWRDDGKAFGPILSDGKMGFRQMKWTHFKYDNFKVWEIKP
jgi:hypothetical protein